MKKLDKVKSKNIWKKKKIKKKNQSNKKNKLMITC